MRAAPPAQRKSFRRVAFIDFDGVTHPARGVGSAVLPFEWVPLLAHLIAKYPDVGVVVHSSWREQFAQDYLQDFLEPVADQFAGVAPLGPKATSIEQYLLAHPEINDAIILDDEPDEVAAVAGVQVLPCDPRLGISAVHTQRVFTAWLERGEAAGL